MPKAKSELETVIAKSREMPKTTVFAMPKKAKNKDCKKKAHGDTLVVKKEMDKPNHDTNQASRGTRETLSRRRRWWTHLQS